ncbi:hypothetical protein [Streptomyces sp. NPDC054940]
MRIRTALAAAALGTLVVLGGAGAANADVDDKTTTGAAFGNESWSGPSFAKDQGGAAFGSEAWSGPSFEGSSPGGEGTQDMGQAQGVGDADSSFAQ